VFGAVGKFQVDRTYTAPTTADGTSGRETGRGMRQNITTRRRRGRKKKDKQIILLVIEAINGFDKNMTVRCISFCLLTDPVSLRYSPVNNNAHSGPSN
jgi:hypothetical protein